jgi:hypothetical protein
MKITGELIYLIHKLKVKILMLISFSESLKLVSNTLFFFPLSTVSRQVKVKMIKCLFRFR